MRSSGSGNGAVFMNAARRVRSRFQSISAESSRSASVRFSATVMPGATVKCWKIMPMPRREASRWLSMRRSRPSIVVLPVSAA